MDYVKEIESKIKEFNNIDDLKDLLPALQIKRNELMTQMSIEPSKEKREEIHNELYDIKCLQRDVKSKVMAIAHTRIQKPNFK